MSQVEIIKDSIGPSGIRLTTMAVKLHRFMLAELNTHRDFSRNSASSRAIPAKTLRDRVITSPATPLWWGANEKGMNPKAELTGEKLEAAKDWWKACAAAAVAKHEEGEKLGICKQILNRVIEPYFMTTVLITATEWDNFFHQRLDGDAQAEIRTAAEAMQAALAASEPKQLRVGEWHLPYVPGTDWEAENVASMPAQEMLSQMIHVSIARCARVSYLNNTGQTNWNLDIDMAYRLLASAVPHMSPAEHVAMALEDRQRVGNFRGWRQYRKMLSNEYAGRENRG